MFLTGSAGHAKWVPCKVKRCSSVIRYLYLLMTIWVGYDCKLLVELSCTDVEVVLPWSYQQFAILTWSTTQGTLWLLKVFVWDKVVWYVICNHEGCWLGAFQLSGMLYKNDVLHIQSWLRVPHPICTLAGHSLGRLFYTPCPTDLQAPMGATLELQRLQHVERLEQQMMWAQLAQQASPRAPQVCMNDCCFM